MTTPLRVVAPVIDSPDQIRATAIEWADHSAALARTLARGLRRGMDLADLTRSVRSQVRTNMALLESMVELLDHAEAVRK